MWGCVTSVYKPPPPSFLYLTPPPHIQPPQPPVFVPSSSFVCLSLQNSWPEARALSLCVAVHLSAAGASCRSRCLHPSSTWAWRWGGWLTSGGLTKREFALTLVETIRGNNSMGEHQGGGWGGTSGWLTVSVHTSPSFLCEVKECEDVLVEESLWLRSCERSSLKGRGSIAVYHSLCVFKCEKFSLTRVCHVQSKYYFL